ncbi:hypothetical protein [Streptomyces sp. NPDC037389]|uniref:hypothetical protein n=1 Tax=Streptomyces sp. NPDC037389 TaxID=3155369 RepID=UPI0033F89CAC
MVQVLLAEDGRAWVAGTEVAEQGTALDTARAAALLHLTRLAAHQARTVHVEATDPDGKVWRLLVHPSGTIEEATKGVFDTDPEGERPPAAFRERVTAIVTDIEAGREHIAMGAAGQLEADIVAAYGERHPYSWRAVELRAHATFVAGLPGAACELYLKAAQGWAGLHSSAYWGAAQRAYACWHRIGAPDQAVWVGQELIEVLRTGGESAQSALRTVLGRMDALQGGLVS